MNWSCFLKYYPFIYSTFQRWDGSRIKFTEWDITELCVDRSYMEGDFWFWKNAEASALQDNLTKTAMFQNKENPINISPTQIAKHNMVKIFSIQMQWKQ